MTLSEIFRLFAPEQPVEYETIDSSRGDGDFRLAVVARWAPGVLPPELGDRMVVKLADNGFTDPERIGLWARLSGEYRSRGYWCPRILGTLAGEYPRVEYEDRRCTVYGEEYARLRTADKFDPAPVFPDGRYTYLDSLLRMNGEIAAARFDFTDLPSAWCLFRVFDPADAEDEVMENAREWLAAAEKLPAEHQPRVRRIWDRWVENRSFLEREYPRLPASVFQADLNSTNILLDGEGRFAGLMDFNLAGREVFLNYLFREVPFIFGKGEGSPDEAPEETILRRILYALGAVREVYPFCQAEKELALPLYRCLCPLWFTSVDQLKAAKTEEEVRRALEDVERAQTREIDFGAYM